MKTVLHIVGGMDRGGAESYIMNTLRNIDRSKYHFIIATFIEPADGKKYVFEDELEKLGVELVRLRDTRFSKPRDFEKQIENIVRKRGVDIVHSHIDFMSALSLAGAKNGGAQKRIAHSHNTNNANLKSPIKRFASVFLKRRLNKLATHRIGCGQAAGEFLFGNHPFTVVSNGIDIDKFKFDKTIRKKLRNQYKIKNTATVWISVGRLEEVKNHKFLIDLLHDHFNDSDTYLFILGNGTLHDKLEEQISSLGLKKKVYLLSARDDINEYYSLADFFVLPSFFEGVPTVGIEAQTNGLKCLFSDKVSTEVKMLDSSEFLPLDDINKWVDLLKKQPPIDDRLKYLHDKSVQAYNIKKTVKKLEEIYDI